MDLPLVLFEILLACLENFKHGPYLKSLMNPELKFLIGIYSVIKIMKLLVFGKANTLLWITHSELGFEQSEKLFFLVKNLFLWNFQQCILKNLLGVED